MTDRWTQVMWAYLTDLGPLQLLTTQELLLTERVSARFVFFMDEDIVGFNMFVVICLCGLRSF